MGGRWESVIETPEFFKFEDFFRADYFLSAAFHLKNNIKFEIYDPENIKSPTFKALIAGIKVVEFFEISMLLCFANCLTSILEGFLG